MHTCDLCEGECDCDGEDLYHETTPEDCEGCGCEEEEDDDYHDMMDEEDFL